jgi:hypothetical protein
MLKMEMMAKEVKRLTALYGGIITPQELVEEAADTASPLHSRFTWDDTEAAKKCRIYEARELLRVCVEILPNDKSGGYTRVTTHLSIDKPGGYRITTDVLSDEELTEIMLKDALQELVTFRKKYGRLKKLVKIMRLIDEAITAIGKR